MTFRKKDAGVNFERQNFKMPYQKRMTNSFSKGIACITNLLMIDYKKKKKKKKVTLTYTRTRIYTQKRNRKKQTNKENKFIKSKNRLLIRWIVFSSIGCIFFSRHRTHLDKQRKQKAIIRKGKIVCLFFLIVHHVSRFNVHFSFLFYFVINRFK